VARQAASLELPARGTEYWFSNAPARLRSIDLVAARLGRSTDRRGERQRQLSEGAGSDLSAAPSTSADDGPIESRYSVPSAGRPTDAAWRATPETD
jgi:hypothetical protein